jgi:hypothetical protein
MVSRPPFRRRRLVASNWRTVVNRFSLSENTFLQATGAKDSAHGETYMYAEKGLWGVSLGKWLKSATYKRTALADVERRVFCSGVDLRRCIFKYASTYFADIGGMGECWGAFYFRVDVRGVSFGYASTYFEDNGGMEETSTPDDSCMKLPGDERAKRMRANGLMAGRARHKGNTQGYAPEVDRQSHTQFDRSRCSGTRK